MSVRRLFFGMAVLAAGLFPSVNSPLAFNLNTLVEEAKPLENLQVDNESAEGIPLSSRAPEPNTLILLFGGITGFLLRFIKRSFEEVKRACDIFLSLIGLAVSLPLLAYAVFMIKFDSPGPVIFKQRRVGKDGRVFTMYKLRTMSHDAERFTGPVWAAQDDPRITRIGALLRKLRIDEIPQLFNVLKGEMSLIGPRPERPEIVNKLKDIVLAYESRLKVKPGITGLAQVLYKYDETLEDVKNKIKFDLLYMQNMSLANDLKILARTFLVVTTGKGAR